MTVEKTASERLENIEKRLKQLQAQKHAIQQRENEKLRKERTRRLIQLGALAEKFFDCKDIEPSDFEEILNKIVNTESIKAYITEKNIQNQKTLSIK